MCCKMHEEGLNAQWHVPQDASKWSCIEGDRKKGKFKKCQKVYSLRSCRSLDALFHSCLLFDHRHQCSSGCLTSRLPCLRAFLFIVLRSAQHPQRPRFFAKFPRNLANAPLTPESFCTCFVCATHAHSHFCPQHWLLCHLGLY